MNSVINQIKLSITNNATKIAVIHKKNSFTYQELDEYSDKLASYLKKNNVQEGSNVAFLMRRSFEILVTTETRLFFGVILSDSIPLSAIL